MTAAEAAGDAGTPGEDEVAIALRAADEGWATHTEARVLAAEVRRIQADRLPGGPGT